MARTVSEAARELGIVPQTVREAIHEEKIVATKVVREGGSPLRPIFLIEDGEIARYRDQYLGKRATRTKADSQEREQMRAAGYVTSVEAAREIGVHASNIIHDARQGRIAGERKNQLWIHRDEVARLKAERDAKMAAMR